MNLNEQISELATSGSLAYAPSDDTIADLLGRTKRARATRQSVATIATTVGALALGIGAAQAYSAAKDDPAFRDRNMINDKDGLTPIELYRAKFGADNPTRTYESQVDLSPIIENLKAAAQTDPKPPAVTIVQPASSGASGNAGSPSGSTDRRNGARELERNRQLGWLGPEGDPRCLRCYDIQRVQVHGQ